MDYILIFTLIRLLVPLFIFKWPLFGIFFSILADLFDWVFINPSRTEEYAAYQTRDKIFDYYYQSIIFLIIFNYKDQIFKNIATAFYIIRTIGVILFYLTELRIFLLFFPNFFENFVIFYLLFIKLTGRQILFNSRKILLSVLTIICIPKIIHEYLMHHLNVQPWQLYNLGGAIGLTGKPEEYTNYIAWGGILYIIPMILLFGFVYNKLDNSK